jgi:hypothetical protein
VSFFGSFSRCASRRCVPCHARQKAIIFVDSLNFICGSFWLSVPGFLFLSLARPLGFAFFFNLCWCAINSQSESEKHKRNSPFGTQCHQCWCELRRTEFPVRIFHSLHRRRGFFCFDFECFNPRQLSCEYSRLG